VPVSYNKLWKLLIDQGLKKMELKEKTGISNSTLAKLSKNQPVAMNVLEKICAVLGCQIGDMVEYIPDGKTKQVF